MSLLLEPFQSCHGEIQKCFRIWLVILPQKMSHDDWSSHDPVGFFLTADLALCVMWKHLQVLHCSPTTLSYSHSKLRPGHCVFVLIVVLSCTFSAPLTCFQAEGQVMCACMSVYMKCVCVCLWSVCGYVCIYINLTENASEVFKFVYVCVCEFVCMRVSL